MSEEPGRTERLDREWYKTATHLKATTGGVVGREPHLVPFSIGGYRILALLGEGGMGIVYQAEQQNPHRIVALKVIRPGVASDQLLRRFEQEAEALGRLQHPGIAQIYEAGTADSGLGPQPFFAMEFIQGRPLIEYASEQHLNLRARIELMARICDAVNHAHQRGIIHRDLKPGNILVDENGQPRVLDFGVARVTNSDAQATRQTDLGQLIGTLAYMSPEQVVADPNALDIRSDVYSLGVILYELLGGRLPHATEGRAMHEVVRAIREEDPAPLSSIHRSCRGDIDTIVATALEKDKARRYASAADLAADMRRYLTDEPIVARPASATYQLQKFARRHKAVVAATVAVFLVLLAGVIVSTAEAVRARTAELAAVAQRKRADQEAAASKAVNDFLQNDLLAQASANQQAGPNTRPDPDLKVRTALDRAAAAIEAKFAGQPLIEASIRETVGESYRDLGLYPDAQRHVERALELRRRFLGPRSPETLASMDVLVAIYTAEGKYPQAQQLAIDLLTTRRKVQDKDSPETLRSMERLATVYYFQGKYAQAEPLESAALEGARRVMGPTHPETLQIMLDLAATYKREGRYTQAEPLYTDALELRRRLSGPEHPETLLVMNNLAGLYFDQGKYSQAEPLYTTALRIRRRILGESHPDTLQSINNLALLYAAQGKYTQAEPLFVAGLRVRQRVSGQTHISTLIIRNNLAELFEAEGRYTRAEALFREALDVESHVLGEEHDLTLESMNGLADTYTADKKYILAEALYARALDLRRRVMGESHPDTLYTLSSLGRVRLLQGNYVEAESVLREALRNYERAMPETWQRYSCESLLGGSLLGQKKFAEAESLLLSGYRGIVERQDAISSLNRVRLREAGERIVQLYREWGKPRKAAEWEETWLKRGHPPPDATRAVR